jgi:uncharacterized protein DUF4157
VKDFEKTTDPAQAAPPGVVRPSGHSHAAGRDVPHVAPHAEAAVLSAPELSHPGNAAPLAGLLTQLQQSHGNAHVQRVVADMNEAKSGAESPQHESEQRIDAGIKSEMESAFRENFGDVRVHTGSQAEKTTKELDARAVTRGRDIYFGRGEYNPATSEGKEVLAHELTHVIQQRSSSSNQQANSIGQVDDAFEQEAYQAAAAIRRGQPLLVTNRSAAPALQRDRRGTPPSITHLPTTALEANTGLVEIFSDFEANLFLSSVPGATVDTLHITVPARVDVSVVDLSGMNLQVRDPGGHGRRVIIIVASRQVRGPRLIQVTFSKGNRVYITSYQLPAASPAAAAPTAPPTPPGGGTR